MYLLRANTIGNAHEMIVNYIMDNGTEQVTEDGERVKQLPFLVCISINSPLNEPMISPKSPYGKGFTEAYVQKVMEITPKKGDKTDPVYTYGNRFRDYPAPGESINDEYQCIWYGNGDGNGIDQIEESIIQRLITNPNSRRAVAITWSPNHDIKEKEPPCLQEIQVTVNKKQCNLFAFIRSNDMLGAWGQNAYALACLQQYIAGRLKKQVGWLEIVSHNPHIYLDHDPDAIFRFTGIRV